MDQKKIGEFLKTLRRERQTTQEQLAEYLGVTNRSVSRWETGRNLPDLDLMVSLANYYDVSIEELLDGERKAESMDAKTTEALLKAADYENNEKLRVSRRLCGLFLAAIAAYLVYAVLEVKGLTSTGIYEDIASFALGLILGVLIVGALFTSRYMAKLHALKRRVGEKLRKF